MKLVQVRPSDSERSGGRQLTYVCVGCHRRVTYPEVFADLDGEPFRDYYCGDCAAQNSLAQ